jgi:hypothetical protein
MPAVACNEVEVFIDQQRACEAKRANAVGDLADLLGRVRTCGYDGSA